MAPGLAADRDLRRRPGRAGQAGRHLHGARLHQPARLPDPVVGPIERLAYRVLRVRPDEGQDWKGYARSLIVFSLLFWVALYLILRTQGIHPFNPEGFHSGPWDLSFNTTSSFVTNTNWQYYGGETTLSYFSQMAGLAVQNFVSAAVGIAVVVALIRGIVARSRPRARQLLAGPGPDPALHPGADLDRRRPLPRLPGGDPEPRRRHRDPHPRAAAARSSARARSPRRRRSRSSAPTAAASSTSTRPSRSRTRAA